jgi:hypothetical protein
MFSSDAPTCQVSRFPCAVPGGELLNCREISCAASLEFPDFTAGARRVRW